MGKRVWRQTFGAGAGTTWFLYSDEGLIQELASANLEIRTYGWNVEGLWGTDAIWQKDVNGTFLAHNDHLYTTDVLTNASDGDKAWGATREAFGKTNVQANSETEYLLRFPGQWADKDAGFHQNWWREYNKIEGKYISHDPMLLLEKYEYGSQNPIGSFDLTGLFSSKYNYKRHIQITEVAYRRTSPCVPREGETIKWSNDYDFAPHSQDIDRAFTHAMTPADKELEPSTDGFGDVRYSLRIVPRMSKAEAKSRWLGFIWENMASCKSKELGFALHALQDSFSPAHADFALWDGGLSKYQIPSLYHIWVDTVIPWEIFDRAVDASASLIKAQSRICNNCPCRE